MKIKLKIKIFVSHLFFLIFLNPFCWSAPPSNPPPAKPLPAKTASVTPPATSAGPRKIALFVGGGGEDPGLPRTMFYHSLDFFSDFSKKNHWETTYLHNGGHADDEAKLKSIKSVKTKNFSVEEFNKTIAQLRTQISQLKKGDEVLINIATHGYESNSYGSHEVSSKNGLVDLRILESVRDEAEKRGVQLAIIDTSCHSGASLKLATPNTCVVTTAGQGVAYGFDMNNLQKNMSHGKNLEEVFLKTRFEEMERAQPGQPQISTPSGKIIYKNTNDLFYEFQDSGDFVDAMKRSRFKSSKVKCTTRNTNLVDLKNSAKEINQKANLSASTGIENSAEWKQFEAQVLKYRTERNKLTNRINDLHSKSKLCENIPKTEDPYCVEITQIDIHIDYNKEQIKANNNAYNVSTSLVERLNKLKKSKEYKAYFEEEKQILNETKKLDSLSKEVARSERKVYQKIYPLLQEKGENPCQKFKL
jgi:hypothetical protein